jgi:hypothetical protein
VDRTEGDAINRIQLGVGAGHGPGLIVVDLSAVDDERYCLYSFLMFDSI